MTTPILRRRFTVAEYYRMAEAGILSEGDRVELIEGEIVEMSPIGVAHAACVDRLTRLFSRAVGDGAIVRVQNPVRLSEFSEPQPDLALLQPKPDFYASGHPSPQDLLLVVEVADTSLDYDRQTKIPLYARAGVPEAWLIDLEDSTISVYRSPSPDSYQETRTLRRGDTLVHGGLADLSLSVGEILG